jgi:uncharacterized protein YbjT (DUF2867 family)
MRILITGSTGYIGGAVAAAAAGAGHEVLALARNDEKAAAARERGWTPVEGDLQRPEGLAAAAEGADAVIHAANTNSDDAAEVDAAATRALLAALAGTGKPFVYTSGVWVLGDTGGAIAGEDWATDAPAAKSA